MQTSKDTTTPLVNKLETLLRTETLASLCDRLETSDTVLTQIRSGTYPHMLQKPRLKRWARELGLPIEEVLTSLEIMLKRQRGLMA